MSELHCNEPFPAAATNYLAAFDRWLRTRADVAADFKNFTLRELLDVPETSPMHGAVRDVRTRRLLHLPVGNTSGNQARSTHSSPPQSTVDLAASPNRLAAKSCSANRRA